jgi:hypothetical protein
MAVPKHVQKGGQGLARAADIAIVRRQRQVGGKTSSEKQETTRKLGFR